MQYRVLVTGGAGFIGSNLVDRLSKEGFLVTSIDNYSLGNIDNHVIDARYINADITNISEITPEFDIIFHLAALSRVQPSFDNPNETFRANVVGTQKICDYARVNDIKLIYAGSASKHNNPRSSPYALTKFLGEEVCKLYKLNFKLEIIRLRLQLNTELANFAYCHV